MEDRYRQFTEVINRAHKAARDRLDNYDDSNDPLTRRQLEILAIGLQEESDEVSGGNVEPYSGQVFGPLKAICDWGEPDGTQLSDAIYQIEVFYRENF